MSRTATRPKPRRTRKPIAAGLVAVCAAIIIGTVALQPTSSPVLSFPGFLPGDHGGTSEADRAVTEADGVLPDDVTAFDDQLPGVAHLDPDLLQALREAASDATDDGIDIHVNSGWRSPEYQNQLFREAVSEYGSEVEAARWVATADTSSHVSGDAVDIGPAESAAWLSARGAAYGLCQIYRNEPWHYELRPEAAEHGCPRIKPDAAHLTGMS